MDQTSMAPAYILRPHAAALGNGAPSRQNVWSKHTATAGGRARRLRQCTFTRLLCAAPEACPLRNQRATADDSVRGQQEQAGVGWLTCERTSSSETGVRASGRTLSTDDCVHRVGRMNTHGATEQSSARVEYQCVSQRLQSRWQDQSDADYLHVHK